MTLIEARDLSRAAKKCNARTQCLRICLAGETLYLPPQRYDEAMSWLRRYLGAAPARGFEHTATREAYVSWWHPHGWWDHYLSMRGTRA
jgi:hypothetical protein